MDNPNLPIILGRVYYGKLYALQGYAVDTLLMRQGSIKHTNHELNIGSAVENTKILAILNNYPELVCNDLKKVRRTGTTKHEIILQDPSGTL